MSKSRCKNCQCLNYNFMSKTYRWDLPPFCGTHGMSPVDPSGAQSVFTHDGSICGYIPKIKIVQLSFDF